MYKWNPDTTSENRRQDIVWENDSVNYVRVMKINNEIGRLENRTIRKENVVDRTKSFNGMKLQSLITKN